MVDPFVGLFGQLIDELLSLSQKPLEPDPFRVPKAGEHSRGLGPKTPQDGTDHLHVREPGLFRPLKALELILMVFGLEKEAGVVDHGLPGLSGGLLVGFEEPVQISGAQRMGEQVLG